MTVTVPLKTAVTDVPSSLGSVLMTKSTSNGLNAGTENYYHRDYFQTRLVTVLHLQ